MQKNNTYYISRITYYYKRMEMEIDQISLSLTSSPTITTIPITLSPTFFIYKHNITHTYTIIRTNSSEMMTRIGSG